MRQLTYAMRFTGQATPANDAGTDLNAAAGVPLGNDASAMETVGNQNAGTMPLPAPADA